MLKIFTIAFLLLICINERYMLWGFLSSDCFLCIGKCRSFMGKMSFMFRLDWSYRCCHLLALPGSLSAIQYHPNKTAWEKQDVVVVMKKSDEENSVSSSSSFPVTMGKLISNCRTLSGEKFTPTSSLRLSPSNLILLGHCFV